MLLWPTLASSTLNAASLSLLEASVVWCKIDSGYEIRNLVIVIITTLVSPWQMTWSCWKLIFDTLRNGYLQITGHSESFISPPLIQLELFLPVLWFLLDLYIFLRCGYTNALHCSINCKGQCHMLLWLLYLSVQPKSSKEKCLLVTWPWSDTDLHRNILHLCSASNYSVNS